MTSNLIGRMYVGQIVNWDLIGWTYGKEIQVKSFLNNIISRFAKKYYKM